MADITIGNMAPLDALSGKEMIPCEIDGKNYKISASTILSYDNDILYRKIDLSEFDIRPNGIDAGLNWASTHKHYAIPVKYGQVVKLFLNGFIDDPTIYDNGESYFVFTTDQYVNPPTANTRIPIAGNYKSRLIVKNFSTVVYSVPENAAWLILVQSDSNKHLPNWEISIGESLAELRLDALENRVNRIEQSPSPANLDSVSREEFDALKKELDSLKAQNTSVVGKETI